MIRLEFCIMAMEKDIVTRNPETGPECVFSESFRFSFDMFLSNLLPVLLGGESKD